jgi:tRNA dimethylallyltransferase
VAIPGATRSAEQASTRKGIFIFRERAELYDRINRRVEKMFTEGVVEEVQAAGEIGATAEKMLGWREIRALIAGQMSEPACKAAIQQATRHYAKRQLTWFQRQTNFEPLNLSLHASSEAIELIAQNVRLAFAQMDD